MGFVIIPISQMIKLRLRDGEYLAQGYRTKKYLSPPRDYKLLKEEAITVCFQGLPNTLSQYRCSIHVC